MSDLIDRQAVLDACQKICDADCEYSKKQRFVMCGACNLGTAIETIEDMPSVTLTERTGHWIEHPHECGENWEYPKYECSECSECEESDSDYCPNCGARMVEPQESEEISDRNIKMWEEIFKAESEDRE